MKKFHITIKDNETGKIIHNVDTDAIIGAVHEEGKTAGIGLTACNGVALLETMSATKKVLKKMTSENPLLSMLDTLENLTKNN